VQITPRSLLFIAALASAALFFGARPGHAYTTGDEKWCAVTNDGGDAVNWECDYDSATDCEPAVVAANRGFCALNPYYRLPEPPPAASQR
jgi:hypothetical protein